jgi:hypothetical protein
MLSFARSEIYIHTSICCIYVYIYTYIIPNFMEKPNSKFKINLIG